MEFKVWVDGFPRVLGGVTEDTTCQDMIIALASAMGRTGRFSLLEKWRDNERTLAPTENPLKILYKWGQYATDVQFHFRLSGKSQTVPGLAQERTKHSLRPLPDQPPNEANVKRSLTFSGGHNVGELSTRPLERLKGQLAGSRGAFSTSALQNRGPAPSSFQRSVPGDIDGFSSRRNHQTVSSQPSSPSKKSLKTGHVSVGAKSRPGKPVPVPRGNVSSSPGRPNNSHLERWSPERVDIREIEKDSRLSPARDIDSTLDFREVLPDNNISADEHESIRVEEYDLDKNFPYTGKPRPVLPAAPGDDLEFSVGPDLEFSVGPDPEHDKLLQLVARQHERLEQTGLQLGRVDADISSLEDSEKSHLEQLTLLDSEISKLQEHSQCYESEIMDLESRRMEDVMEAEKHTEHSLHLEISSLGSKLSKSEQELLLTEDKINLAQQNLAKENARLENEQQIFKEKEINAMQELSSCKQEITQKLSEQECNDTEHANIDREVRDLENVIAYKKDELDSLENDLKQANMVEFDLSPVEATSPTPMSTGLSENGEAVLKLLESKTPIRIGSTRKMIGSPQKLGEAAPTTKNPHGIWV